AFGVSEVVIGLTLVAVGTSLPEFATSAVAALRRHSEIALGNILGSNIYNILAILGIASLIAPVPIPPEIARIEMWVMAVFALFLVPALVSGRVGRALGAAMLAGYAAYVGRLVALA
ncbi:MAG: sodium:calcium antiporter, partial [Elioraea sp.]|nr:sodium:calcium antiporter [Elioraea sp.]